MNSIPWRDPLIPLGMRCVMLAQAEMQRGAKAQPHGQPNTSSDVEMYLAGCVRNLDEDPELEKLNLKEGNWCAGFASWCLENCILEGEERPHHYRAGVVELIADAKIRGRWHPAAEVRAGRWTPSPGDLVIWDRSEPGKPETSWWRHVNRLVGYIPASDTFSTIGGNEGRAIRFVAHPPKGLDSSKLIGFISYSQPHTKQITDEDRQLVAAFVEAHRREVAWA